MENVYQNDSKVKTLDPPKPSFFIGGVAKITICPLPPNAPKKSPKRYLKWYPNQCKLKKKRVPKITGPCAWTMKDNEQQVSLPGVLGWGTTNPIKPAFFHFFRKWDPSGDPDPSFGMACTFVHRHGCPCMSSTPLCSRLRFFVYDPH